MKVELPLGDVVDRVSIDRIKEQRLTDARALAHVREELATLGAAWEAEGHPPMHSLDAWEPLVEVNGKLWEVEDALRDCERQGRFDDHFVQLARSVYHLNDRRAALKRQINEALGSRLVEEKSYQAY